MLEEFNRQKLAEERRHNLATEAKDEKDRMQRYYGDTVKAAGGLLKGVMGKNDYSFYAAYDEELSRIGTSSFSFPNGNVMPFGESMIADLSAKAIVVKYLPTLGQAGRHAGSSVVGMRGSELAFDKLYTALLVPNTGYTSNYSRGDIGKYLGALDSCYILVWKVLRAIGIINYYEAENMIQSANFIVTLLGFDYYTMKAELSLWIDLVNSWIEQLSIFPLPIKMTLFARHIWLESNIFRECDSEQGKLIMFDTNQLLKYDVNKAALIYTKVNAMPTVALANAEFMKFLEPLAASDDFRIIAKDIVRLAKSKEGAAMGFTAEYPLSRISYDFTIKPFFDETALLQFENANYFRIPKELNTTRTVGDDTLTAQYFLGYELVNNQFEMRWIYMAGSGDYNNEFGNSGLPIKECIPVAATCPSWTGSVITYGPDLYNKNNLFKPVFVCNQAVAGTVGSPTQFMETIDNVIKYCQSLNFDFNDISYQDVVEATREKLVFNRLASNSFSCKKVRTDGFTAVAYNYDSLYCTDYNVNLLTGTTDGNDSAGLLFLDDFGDAIFECISYHSYLSQPNSGNYISPIYIDDITSFISYYNSNGSINGLYALTKYYLTQAHTDFDHHPVLYHCSHSWGGAPKPTSRLTYSLSIVEGLDTLNPYNTCDSSGIGSSFDSSAVYITQFISMKRWRFGRVDQLKLAQMHKWCLQSEFGAVDPTGTFGLKQYGPEKHSDSKDKHKRGNKANKGNNRQGSDKKNDPNKDKDK